MARETVEVLWVRKIETDCGGLFKFSQLVKQPQGILDWIQLHSLDMGLSDPLFLALIFACLTAQWWESRIFDYINLFLHRCHLILQLCTQHLNIFLGHFLLTMVSSQWGADETWQTFITSLRWCYISFHIIPEASCSLKQSLAWIFFCSLAYSSSKAHRHAALLPPVLVWVASYLWYLLCSLQKFLFQTHATILLLVMWLFAASVREPLWAKEHS